MNKKLMQSISAIIVAMAIAINSFFIRTPGNGIYAICVAFIIILFLQKYYISELLKRNGESDEEKNRFISLNRVFQFAAYSIFIGLIVYFVYKGTLPSQ